MKKITVGALASLGVLAAASPRAAAGPNVPVQPHVMTLMTSRIVSIGKGPTDAAGNWQVDVGVENVSGTARKLALDLHGAGVPSAAVSVVVDVAPGATHHFLFADTQGGPPTCGLNPTKEYTMTLSDSGTPSSHRAILRANNCSFQTTITNPWDQLTPDHEQSLETGSLYVWQAHLVTPQTCAAPLKVQAQVSNKTGKTQSSLALALMEGTITDASAGGISIGNGKVVDVTLTATTPVMQSAVIRLNGGTNVQQSLINVKVISSCTYTSQIDPPAEAVPVTR